MAPSAKILPFRRRSIQPSPAKGFFEQEEASMARCWRAEWVSGCLMAGSTAVLWWWTGAAVFGMLSGMAGWMVFDAWNFWHRQRVLAERLRRLEENDW